MLSSADAYLYRPTSVDKIESLFRLAKGSGRQVLLRGAGRSYGDANIARESVAIDFQRMRRILSWDPIEGGVRGRRHDRGSMAILPRGRLLATRR
jgi:decaprenylphospho-beta-D-ribofuranose 2-oxidase